MKSNLFAAFLCFLMVLPAMAQEEPDTTTVEEEVVIVKRGNDRSVTVTRNGEEVELSRERMRRMLSGRLRMVPELDSLPAGVRVERNGNQIVIYGGGERDIRRVITIGGDSTVTIRGGNQMRRGGMPRILSHRNGEVTVRIEKDADGDTTIVTHIGREPVRMRSRDGRRGGQEIHRRVMSRVHTNGGGQVTVRIEKEVEADGDTTIVTHTTREPVQVRGRDARRARQEIQRRSRRGDRGRWQRRSDRGSRGEQSSELRQMEDEARRLAREVRGAEGEERAAQEQTLREHLGKMFDLKLQQEEERWEAYLEGVDERFETWEARAENREQIIEERLSQLLRRGSSYRW